MRRKNEHLPRLSIATNVGSPNVPVKEPALRIKLDLASVCFGFALGVALLATITLPQLARIPAHYLATYGDSLADMAAAQAIEPSFNSDRIGQQAILQEVMNHPYTLLATIHDVENTLLVQAGDARTLDKQASESFTAPIVLHNNIAGYLTVHLASEQNRIGRWLYGTWLACALLALFSGWRLHAQGWLRLPALHIRSSPPSNSDTVCETLSHDDIAPQDPELVYAVIHIKNLRVLHQQLNGENFRKTLMTVEQRIADVLALYSGAGYHFHDNVFELRFFANDATEEALFRAVCSAWLIVELCSIVDKIPLDLAAFVSANPLDLTPAELPIAGLVLETLAANDELLTRRLHFLNVGSEDGRAVVAGFEQPYQTLLEKQRAQLSIL